MIAEPLQPLAVPIGNLTTDPTNARRGDVAAVRRSLATFGQRKPVVVKRTGMDAAGGPTGVVEAGNTTFTAACDLGWTHIAAVFVDDDSVTARAFALADNRTGELALWDEDQLTASLQELAEHDFDMAALGWSDSDLATLLGGPDDEPSDLDDDVPLPMPDPVTRPGDVWTLGRHRLVCGDCRDAQTVAMLLDGAQVNLAFTSPPYASQRAYDEASGFTPIAPDEYVEWFAPVQANVRAALASDGSWFVNIKAHSEHGQRVLYVMDLVLAHVRRWNWRFVDELCWTHQGLPGAWDNRLKNQFEPIYHFSANRKIKFRPQSNATDTGLAFSYPGKRIKRAATGNPISFSSSDVEYSPGSALPGNVIRLASSNSDDARHEAVFPVHLPAWFIRAYTDPGDAVLDPFMGSGSTLIAADREERTAYGIEISPSYCDVICHRYQRTAGVLPVRNGTPHDFLEGEDGHG